MTKRLSASRATLAALAITFAFAPASLRAQLPAEAVQLDKLKISENIKSDQLDPITFEPSAPDGPAWEYKGVKYRGASATSKDEFMKDPDANAEKAARERWVRNFVENMSKIWCPVTDELNPGGLLQWERDGITWESCCAFCDESVTEEDFPKALDRLKLRALKSYELVKGVYVVGASSPIEGAIDPDAKPAEEGDASAPAGESPDPMWLQNTTLEPTYSGGVALIFANRCLECHRPGGLAPMSFSTLQEIKKWSKSLKNSIVSKSMPPWPVTGSDFHFANSRALTQRETDLLVKWIDGGYPPGAPLPKVSPSSDWFMGEPDAVFEIPGVELSADEADPVREFTINNTQTQDRFVIATEARPGNEFQIGAINAGPLGVYAPSNFHQEFPAGVGAALKAGEKITVRVMFKKEKGSPATIPPSQLAVKFAPEAAAVKSPAGSLNVAAADFTIPAGAEKHEVKTTQKIEADTRIIAITPIMNRRGKSLTASLKLPDGSTRKLVEIAKWSPDVKYTYTLAEPVAAPKGSTLEITGVYDNSKLNVSNPDATVDVKSGPGGETLEAWLVLTEK